MKISDRSSYAGDSIVNQVNPTFDIGTVFMQGWQAFKSNAGVLIVSALIATGPVVFLVVALFAYIIESAYLASAEIEKEAANHPVLSSPDSSLKSAKPDAKSQLATDPLQPSAGLSHFEIFSIGYWGIVLLVYIPVTLWLHLGQVAIWLKVARGQPARVRDLFFQWRQTGTFLIAGLMFTIIMWIGCALVVIPGLIVALLGCLYPWFIVDQNMKGLRSLTASFNSIRSPFLNVAFLLCLFMLCCVIYVSVNFFVALIPCFGTLIGMATPIVLVPLFGLILTYVYLALIGESTGSAPEDRQPGDPVYAESPS